MLLFSPVPFPPARNTLPEWNPAGFKVGILKCFNVMLVAEVLSAVFGPWPIELLTPDLDYLNIIRAQHIPDEFAYQTIVTMLRRNGAVYLQFLP